MASERRYGLLVDGPRAGGQVPTVSSLPWPDEVCTQAFGGVWEHYRHRGLGRYWYAGRCDGVLGHRVWPERCDAG